jgi:hypothetical protein
MPNITCPVCGYDQLEFPPVNFSICGCCGTEFGYDDRVLTHGQLTQRWIANGCPWFDPNEQKPYGWNAWKQIIDARLSIYLPIVAKIQLQANATIDGRGIHLGASPFEVQAA